MKEKFKTITAFVLLAALIITSFVLSASDRRYDIYPDADTMIMLYGESHGVKEYYDIELELWEKYYAQGCRSLFVELPYYSAEFLNLWMKADDDEIIDAFFEDIRGTLSDNSYYHDFLHRIKENCPETVFYGTDVGHQYDTTGRRYLQYLHDSGLSTSENYALAYTCIRQGKDYYASERTESGISDVREAYMVSNFINAYERCGGKIMGIYGSWHTQPGEPDRMAARLISHYGNIVSTVRLSSLLTDSDPYAFGLSVSSIVFLLMLLVPNIIWAKKGKPQGYEEASAKENRFLLMPERIGEVSVTAVLLVFGCFDPCIRKLPEGLYFDYRIILWLLAFGLMILYEIYWIRYFRSSRTLKDMYSSFAGFPCAGASLPVMAALLLGIYSSNALMICASVILGTGHIGIHLMHRRDAETIQE